MYEINYKNWNFCIFFFRWYWMIFSYFFVRNTFCGHLFIYKTVFQYQIDLFQLPQMHETKFCNKWLMHFSCLKLKGIYVQQYTVLLLNFGEWFSVPFCSIILVYYNFYSQSFIQLWCVFLIRYDHVFELICKIY